MRRFGMPVAPAVVGMILGPVAETNLRRALAISEGNPGCWWLSPFSGIVYVVAPWSCSVGPATAPNAAEGGRR